MTDSLDPLTKQNIAQALWMQTYDEKKIPARTLEKINSVKNSNANFTERFRKRLSALMENELSFVTPRNHRYEILMNNADNISPQACYASNLFLGPESVTGYASIPLDPLFIQPAIDAPQLNNQVGWHFFVGNFKDADGNHYSIEMMFWQYAQLPPAFAASLGLSDIENQTLEMHLAVCDPQTQKQYRSTTAVVAGTTGLVSFNAAPYRYSMGNNQIKGLGNSGALFPANLIAKGFDMSNENHVEEFSININVHDVKGIFLEGDQGCAPSVDGVGTLYYSSSLLKLITGIENTITLDGKTIQITEGSMWYDHQWGTGFMPSGAPKHAVMRALQNLSTPAPGGWDWFMFQFYQDDNICPEGEVQLTVSALHTAENERFYFQTGATPPGVMTAEFSGKYIGASKSNSNIPFPVVATTEITGTLTVREWVQVNSSPNPKVYPPTNTWYPAGYEFAIEGDIPTALKNLIATPLIASGQTGFFGTGLQYTEGGTIITNPAGKEIGRGFAEGTNWADSTDGIISLAGLPVNETTRSFLTPPNVSLTTKIVSGIEVICNLIQLKNILGEAKGLSGKDEKKHEQAMEYAQEIHAENKR